MEVLEAWNIDHYSRVYTNTLKNYHLVEEVSFNEKEDTFLFPIIIILSFPYISGAIAGIIELTSYLFSSEYEWLGESRIEYILNLVFESETNIDHFEDVSEIEKSIYH